MYRWWMFEVYVPVIHAEDLGKVVKVVQRQFAYTQQQKLFQKYGNETFGADLSRVICSFLDRSTLAAHREKNRRPSLRDTKQIEIQGTKRDSPST
eukprot:UN19387